MRNRKPHSPINISALGTADGGDRVNSGFNFRGRAVLPFRERMPLLGGIEYWANKTKRVTRGWSPAMYTLVELRGLRPTTTGSRYYRAGEF